MASNFLHEGCVLEFTAPTGGVTSGTPVLIGGFFAIPLVTALATVRFNGQVDGVWALPRTASETWLEGQVVFWDVTNAKASIDPTVGHLPIGGVEIAGASTDTTGAVKLNGTSFGGRVLNVRRRIAVATVSAGTTLIPAITGARYRMIHATAISVGGAAAAVTTVDILGTVSSARKLVAFAQASLTQSTVLKDGGTGAAVLADGASYTPNDVSTAITVGITGSAITTATSIDFNVDYSLE